MKQSVIFAAMLGLVSAQDVVQGSCLQKTKTFGSASGSSWDDTSLIAGKIKTDWRLKSYQQCTKQDSLGQLRLFVGNPSSDRDQIRLSANGAFNEGDCGGGDFEFTNMDQVTVYTTGSYVSGITFRKREGAVETRTLLEIGRDAETNDTSATVADLPNGYPIVGSTGTWDSTGLTSIAFITLDLACAGGEVEEAPEGGDSGSGGSSSGTPSDGSSGSAFDGADGTGSGATTLMAAATGALVLMTAF